MAQTFFVPLEVRSERELFFLFHHDSVSGMLIICKRNADKNRLSGMLAHEITHHMVSEISNATPYSMKRKETCDVPMWLEEGLCQLIQSELCPALQDE